MSNRRLTVLVGPPGSGKSQLASNCEGFVRVSQDDQGKEGHKLIFAEALSKGLDIVVDRMNFNKEQRARYIVPAKEAGYEIVVKTLFVPYDICLERCLKRENHPTIKDEISAKAALRTFFSKFERPTEDEGDTDFEYYNNNIEKQGCIIVDLDGTLCNIDHRLHHIRTEGKKNWKSFLDELVSDVPNLWCLELVNNMPWNIVFCSGRPDSHMPQTKSWLQHHVNRKHADLFMRSSNDFRQDYIIKEILLDFEIHTRYDVLFAVDDRKQVVDLWRRRGIVCLQCAPGDF